MKRPLAQEALSHAGHYDDHHPPSSLDEAMRQAPERLRKLDPNGNRAKSLLDEISNQQTK